MCPGVTTGIHEGGVEGISRKIVIQLQSTPVRALSLNTGASVCKAEYIIALLQSGLQLISLTIRIENVRFGADGHSDRV